MNTHELIKELVYLDQRAAVVRAELGFDGRDDTVYEHRSTTGAVKVRADGYGGGFVEVYDLKYGGEELLSSEFFSTVEEATKKAVLHA